MLARWSIRKFVTNAVASRSDKDLLMNLRKSTGYSFQNCRKAIEKFGEDITAAEKWLRKKAMEEGWSKLGVSRKTAAGLVGLLLANNRQSALMLELNCETDFVAKNEKFRQLIADACHLAFAQPRSFTTTESNPAAYAKFIISDQSSIDSELESSKIGDLMAQSAGQLGEKISFSRLLFLKSGSPDSMVCGYVHPKTDSVSGVLMGQIGALVITTTPNAEATGKFANIGTMLCQHIVGMNPSSLGTYKPQIRDVESERSDDEKTLATTFSDDTELLNQDFLIQPDIKVGHFLEMNGIQLHDFVRFKCGEKA